MEWIGSFKENAVYYLRESVRMIERSLAEFNDEEIWHKPNEELNSMANLLLHLSGNIRQYIISSLGQQTDTRQRDLEFSQSDGPSKDQLLAEFKSTVDQAISVIQAVPESELLCKRVVQDKEHDGLGIVIHVVEHLSYHTGQIAFWVKYRKAKDLGFYEGRDLNALNP